MSKYMKKLFFPIISTLWALVWILAAASCHDNGEPVLLEVASGDDQTGVTGRELPKPIVVRTRTYDGNTATGVPVSFEITAGGGSLSAPLAVTDSDGMASVRWTLGVPPVWNRIQAKANGSVVTLRAWAEPGEPPALDSIYKAPSGIASEDLAFWPGRGLFLGSPGAILYASAPGAPLTVLDLTGEGIYVPVGIAFGPSGNLYACENVSPRSTAVKRITPSGACDTLSEGFGGHHFSLPNYIAVDGSGELYLTATCDNMIYRISHLNGETKEFLSIPGPNGLAFNNDYSFLYITIENPSLICCGMNVQGGLFRVPIGLDGKPGDIETLIKDFAVVGDGLAFDGEGNLYAVFTEILGRGGEGLFTSGVFVYTPDGKFNEFFSLNMLRGEIITNVAFGIEPFDPLSLYCYGFTGKLYRIKVGIKGRPLP